MPSETLLRMLDRVQFEAKNAFLTLSACICAPSSSLKINGRTFRIVKLLGEGGFSFVYLAQDEASGREFALKKIRCPSGSDGVAEAMREVEAYGRFKHKNIIRILDSAVIQDPEGDGKIVYLFLPLYKKGNLQDAINAHVTAGTHFPEREILRYFKGTCEAVRAMHDYKPAGGGANNNPNSEAAHHDGEGEGEVLDHHHDHDDDGASVPLVAQQHRDGSSPVFDGDEEEASALERGTRKPGEIVPYAHRDLKPANVMIADDGVTPILMDFGSAMKARIPIHNRSQALLQQDIAAEKSTMAYRAPELFDVNTGITLDEKVDIWSLGCILFALAYLHSPFENLQTAEHGGSIAMAVMSARYKHPANTTYSKGLKDLIDSMLKINPQERPDIHQVLEETEKLLRG